ncbi:MAG: DUF4190 domain-containing protein [Deltaproteobacteria bacterium]|nr:DUF4190 domain-containing protein [Deltaproteobacteria bacterium]
MRVFCSQCGTPNDGQPGTKVMCTNCTAVFEVPGTSNFGVAQTVMSGTPPPGAPSPLTNVPTQPGAPNFPPTPAPQNLPAPNAPSWGAPAVNPGQPGPIYPAPANQAASGTNGLAIASLVLGILCCIPFASIAAIVTGALAIQQIDANRTQTGKGLAIAGISLGGISLLFTILGIIGSLVGHH